MEKHLDLNAFQCIPENNTNAQFDSSSVASKGPLTNNFNFP